MRDKSCAFQFFNLTKYYFFVVICSFFPGNSLCLLERIRKQILRFRKDSLHTKAVHILVSHSRSLFMWIILEKHTDINIFG